MDWSYKDMVISKMQRTPDDQTARTIQMTDDFIQEMKKCDPAKVERFLLCIAGSLNGWHFDECLGWHAICKMQPVGMTMEAFKAKLPEPSRITTMIHEAHERAKMKARERGFEAPALAPEYTAWDYYVTYAMMWADYWSIDLNCDKASDMVYCFLSDPDYPTKHKIWDYLYK